MPAIVKSKLCPFLVLALLLPACRTLPPPSTPPTPPDVRQCREGHTRDVSSVPWLAAGQPITDRWMKAMWNWSNDALGILTQERQLRQAEHDCEDELAKEGYIR